MKAIIILLFSISFLIADGLKAQTKKTTKFPGTPFQGIREYCNLLKPLQYKVTIHGYNVSITKYYDKEKGNTIKGIYKKGKIYTNDPLEKQFHMTGRYYVIYPSTFGFSNLEGGDYVTCELCK